MKTITIRRMTLENFKCHKFLELDFGGASASIFGDNATGKTSIYDALTWLLFGVDSRGNGEKTLDIKPLDSAGEVRDHDAITSVEAELSVTEDGETRTVALKRTLREVWASRRGSSELVFDGNTSDYYVDGVPMKKAEYAARIADIIPDDVFRLLTSVTYFPEDLEWKKRRELLHAVSGTAMDDRSLMLSQPQFSLLADCMGRLSLDDYRKKLTAQRKGLLGTRDEIPARINECEVAVQKYAALDFDAAQNDLAACSAELDRLQAQEAELKNDQAALRLRNELGAAELERRRIEDENRLFRQQQEAQQPNVAAMEANVQALRSAADRHAREISRIEKDLTACETAIEAQRTRWIEINGTAFSGGVCPSCGQTLPVERLKLATERFDRDKTEKLRDTEALAARYKAEKARLQSRMEEAQAEKENAEAALAQAETALQAAQAERTEIRDMDCYAGRMIEAEKTCHRLEQALSAALSDKQGQLDAVAKAIRKAREQLSSDNEVLAKKSVLDLTRQRIGELRQQAQAAAKELEDVEKRLYLMDAFIRYKTKTVESSINSRFRLATFRLFRQQANGGVEERCDVTCDGVPYRSLNNGMRINVGIDIINTLSDYYGVRVPLFVDNAESVTSLEQTGAQVIRLVVSAQDKALRFEPEHVSDSVKNV